MPFRLPPALCRQVAGVPFEVAVDFAVQAKQRYERLLLKNPQCNGLRGAS